MLLKGITLLVLLLRSILYKLRITQMSELIQQVEKVLYEKFTP